MLHHVAIEVHPADAESDGRFWAAVGFTVVTPPAALGPGFDWFERAGTQVHLIHREKPVVPEQGHPAVVTDDFDSAIERVRALGIEVEEGRQLWGERRAKAALPSGHTVELMAAPPDQP